MRNGIKLVVLLVSLWVAGAAMAQTPVKLPGGDARFKADILVVVAHPDDEGAVTPYLARAIYDQHKSVAVVYGTHGGSGGNSFGRERAGALEDIREMEAREACARLGITNVWFLEGKDTASQNVVNSLASWGHGANLEKLVELIRLTRPEVIITSLPGMFIGENHGDHQAAGVLTTEAFDLAGRAAVFPSQLAAASPKREVYLENLNPWQPKKLYYFSDAEDEKQFAGSGPAYSITEISPSQKKAYWRLALDAAMTHLTQYPQEIHTLMKLSDADIEKMMGDPHRAWWSNPETLIFGRSAYEMSRGQITDDVFTGFAEALFHCPLQQKVIQRPPTTIVAQLGGPWGFYEDFRYMHCTYSLPSAKIPEIAVKNGSIVIVPITIHHDADKELEVTVSVALPARWKAVGGTGKFVLPAEEKSDIQLQIETPTLSDAELKETQPQILPVTIEKSGQASLQVTLKVLLRSGALPQ